MSSLGKILSAETLVFYIFWIISNKAKGNQSWVATQQKSYERFPFFKGEKS